MNEEDRHQAPGASGQRLWIAQRELASGGLAWMNRAIDGLAREIHPVLGLVRRERVWDLPKPHQGAGERETDEPESPLFRSLKVEHQWLVDLNEALTFDMDSFLSRLFETSDAIGGQLAAGMFEHISDVTEQTGNVVNVEGGDIVEALLQGAEKVEWSFDENENPQMTFVVAPDVEAKLRESPPTREQEERMRKIQEGKLEEWRASRRRRELP